MTRAERLTRWRGIVGPILAEQVVQEIDASIEQAKQEAVALEPAMGERRKLTIVYRLPDFGTIEELLDWVGQNGGTAEVKASRGPDGRWRGSAVLAQPPRDDGAKKSLASG